MHTFEKSSTVNINKQCYVGRIAINVDRILKVNVIVKRFFVTIDFPLFAR